MKPHKKKNTTTRRKKQSHKTPRRRRAEQENLKANGKPIDDGRARLDKVEHWEAERVDRKAERRQLKNELDDLDAKIRAEIKRAGLERYRTDPSTEYPDGRIITIRVKETAASRPAPKVKGRKRREAEQAVAAQA